MAISLLAFLRDRLAEDEAKAKAATPGPWWHNPAKLWMGPEAFEQYDRSRGEEFVGYGGPSPFVGCIAATGPADHPQSMRDADYIAHWDPVRALREAAAKRSAIEEYQSVVESLDRYEPVDGTARAMVSSLRGVLEAAASVYADHPDYCQEWKP